MLRMIKRWVLSKLTEHLLASVQEKYVITTATAKDGRSYYLLDGKTIPVEYLRRLKQECSVLEESEIWKIFDNTLRSHAHKAMFVRSQTFEDVMVGKLMLYNLDIQKKIVNTLAKIQLQ